MYNFKDENDLKRIVLTASKVLAGIGHPITANLLAKAQPSIQQTGYENWNNGIYLYTMYLTVNVDTYIGVKSDLSNHNILILDTIKEICAPIDDEVISAIKVVPSIADDDHTYASPSVIANEEPTFWKPGYFKLFLSHLATYKEKTSALKNALEGYGISSFVAHEDIEPTKEWQDEIEQGLFTMDALCAILMEGFNLSNWTDQEIGVAIGRNILVIPIRKGMNPYGFIGKYQGFQAENRTVADVALGIFQILSSNVKTANTILLKLSELFLLSNNITDATKRVRALRKITSIPIERVEMIQQRVKDNNTLKSPKVLLEVNELLKGYGLREVKRADFDKVTISPDDDLPF
ncbi:toll/interleukin-1 receptor domain-containing protein [Pedobacter agri]|uniref:Toll/interleukin-1 receptor domain-containing protein n=1 Tax=Pedobacter agri TaxID=454586 RepID=A0A9X3DFT5_9SPHI|nr:toll/interleukin-1 receptor domain-containing protein [Pedobacter agri]MCX3266452.1 toll/interleukin-1 receptor domain-containing protein [Pedobacter agri]